MQTTTMQATMMHTPMTVRMIMEHGASVFPQSLIATSDGKDIIAATYFDVADNAARFANGLKSIGVTAGDRVGTFCWNHRQHMEAYLAIPSMGAIMHTVNIRLSVEHIAYIINHAGDKVVLVDTCLLDIFKEVLPHLRTVETLILIGDESADIEDWNTLHYQLLTAQHDAEFAWPDIDETTAAAVCYTSGTTGSPKGVVYSHRTTVMHSLASRATDTFGICERDRILLLPPMFHANSWGLPYSGWFSGSDIIMPASHMQIENIVAMIRSEQPTFTAMVPTLLSDLLRLSQQQGFSMSSFRMLVCGGSAVAPTLIDSARERWAVPVLQGWGMTETSPLCALSHPPRDPGELGETAWRAKSGRPVPGVQVRVVDDQSLPLAHDGQSVGELQLRGPWITGAYHQDDTGAAFTEDGWLRTGDVGHIDERHYVQLTDRTKDVIKSGGEWISSVDLEGALLAHPAIAEAAVVAVEDERWQERPLAIVVADGDQPSVAELRDFLAARVAKFWVPEYWTFVDSIAKTSVGKIDKKVLRNLRDENAFDISFSK
ncbi:MAG: long-chain-fatty-acid--CoA ligase [Pseudomonadales bacterium]